jgi:hypothetical protein
MPFALIASEMTGSGTNMEVWHKDSRQTEFMGELFAYHGKAGRSISKGISRGALDTKNGADLPGTDGLDILEGISANTGHWYGRFRPPFRCCAYERGGAL